MDTGFSKIVGALCLGACAICAYVAIDKYQANANNFRAMPPFARSLLGADATPAVPSESKYLGLVACLFGVGGVLFIVRSRNQQSTEHARERCGSRSETPEQMRE